MLGRLFKGFKNQALARHDPPPLSAPPAPTPAVNRTAVAPPPAAPVDPDKPPPEALARLNEFLKIIKEHPQLFTEQLREIARDDRQTKAQLQRRIIAHPDYAAGWRQIEEDRKVKAELAAMPLGDQILYKLGSAGFQADETEAALFGNPNEMIRYVDRRPLYALGFNHRWTATYARVVGTLTDKERFVFLMTFFCEESGIYNDEEAASAYVSALNGGNERNVEWELDPTYTGEQEERNLKNAKERFKPDPVEKAFEVYALGMFQLEKRMPDHPLVLWAMKTLRPHSAGWATSR